MGTLKVMDGTGDTHLIWDSTRPDEVAAARRTFDDLRAKKYNAYAVKPGGGVRGEIVTAFDPAMEKIILAPALAGG